MTALQDGGRPQNPIRPLAFEQVAHERQRHAPRVEPDRGLGRRDVLCGTEAFQVHHIVQGDRVGEACNTREARAVRVRHEDQTVGQPQP